MAIDRTLLNSLLDNLKTAILKIENMDVSMEHILEDEDVQDLLDRRMQVAIENCIDIATHISAGMELPRREHASDVFILLGENNIISKEVVAQLAGAVGLRNILVHEYTAVDYKLAYSDLKDKLTDIKTFAGEVLEFMEKNKDIIKLREN